MSMTTRRRLTLQEKRADRDFDNETFTRMQRTVPYRYEEVPEHKSYLDMGVRNIVAQDSSRKNAFMPRNRAYDYEVVTPVAEEEVSVSAPADELDVLRLKPEACPSEETMKILLSDRASADTMERMLSGTKRSAQRAPAEEVIFIDDSVEEEQSERQTHIGLSTRGKVTVAAYIAVILTMLIIALVTASSIATLSAQEQSLKADLWEINAQVAALAAEADTLSADDIIEAKAEMLGMYTPAEGSGLATVTVPTLKAETPYNVPTNWFDDICKFIANLFGR